ncbi:MAG: LptF/LptG family permease [Candidatus Omnitrophica bacterium]|nr:LptF/LptG family permease [Candidatus Omnitrophota bacterium]
MVRKRYLLKEFFTVWFLVTLGFLALFVVIQILTDLPQKIQMRSSRQWESYWWQLPLTFVEISPILTLLTGLFLLAEMMKNGEIRVLELGGLFPFLIYDMLLLSGLVTAGVAFLVNEQLVPSAYTRLRPLKALTQVHLSAPSFLFYTERFVPPAYVENLQVSYSLSDGNWYTLTAKQGWFQSGFWLLRNGQLWGFEAGRLKEEIVFKQTRIQLPVTPDLLTFSGQSFPCNSLKQLLLWRSKFSALGFSKIPISVSIQERIAYPALCFFIIFASIPFFLWRGHLTRFFVLSFSFLFSFGCYFVYSISISLARSGRVPVFWGVWLVHGTLVFLAAVCVIVHSWKGIFFFSRTVR